MYFKKSSFNYIFIFLYHTFRYFKAFKATPYTEGAPHHEKRPWIYDPVDGKVMCLTARDIQNQNK